MILLETNFIVLPYVEILPFDTKEFEKAAEILKSINIRSFDALHAAATTINGISKIAPEDGEFDKIKEMERI